ncbi:MAG: hypothetical protein AAF871_15855 [Pseudomonadota bacterium]
MAEEALARLDPKGPRRILAVAAIFVLALLVAQIAVAGTFAPLARLALLAFAGALFWIGWRVWQATGNGLLLTEDGLFDDQGRLLAAMDNIRGLDRGLFDIKPSSGFTVKLNEPMGRAWAPGVWWRIGRRLGIGGAVPGRQAKAMAEILAAYLAHTRPPNT